MTYKILLIDDSLTQLETLKLRFSKAGFQVETAQNGGEGYQKVFATAPDIILSDIIMPALNGYQLCRLLKNNPVTNQIPVILLTVLDKKIDKFWGNKSGANKFISKTESFEHITAIVNDLLQKYPVNEEYRQELLKYPIADDAIQNQINSVLDELLMNSTFLNEFRDLSEFLTHEKVLIEKTFRLLRSFVEYNIAGLFFNHMDRNEKNILHFDFNKNPISNFVVEKIKRDFFSQMPELREFTIRDFGHDVVRERIDEQDRIVSPEQLKSSLILPILFEGKLMGGVCFYSMQSVKYEDFKFFDTMVKELILLFKMRYLYSETEYLSVTDGLTGLYNRRHFEHNIEREFLRTKRYKSDLSLAIIDIDHFKNINDTYGHQFGDYVLKEISKLLDESFRKTDMIYRYGGEELTIILTETSMENALIPLQRLREKISNHDFIYGEEKARVTVSIGLSTSIEQMKTQKDLVEAADKALYKAKQDGRNKVVSYSYEQFEQIAGQ